MKKRPGYYWFPNDCLGDEGYRTLSYAARGLWRDMLDVMHFSVPRGVLPGNLDALIKRLGAPADVRISLSRVVDTLLREMEEAGVFARGATMPGNLEPDAIVNRRMYREWLRAQSGRTQRVNAARARWGKTRMRNHAEPMRGTCGEHPGTHAKTDAETNAGNIRGTSDVTNVNSTDSRVSSDAEPMRDTMRDTMREPMRGACITPTHTLRSLNTDQRSKERSGVSTTKRSARETSIESVGSVIDRTIIDRLVRATGDASFRKAAWTSHIAAAIERNGIQAIWDLIDHVEKDSDPRLAAARGESLITSPARYVASEIMRMRQ